MACIAGGTGVRLPRRRNDGLPAAGLLSVVVGVSPYTDESSIVISSLNRPSSCGVETLQSMLVPTS